MLERYGMTRTNMNASNPSDGERCPARSGIPCPASPYTSPIPRPARNSRATTIGMIEVKGPNVFSGYSRMPEKTKAEFRNDGFFITGDLGKIDPKATSTSSAAARI